MLMQGEKNRLFVGMKISTTLQRDLDRCAGGAERYFDDKPESLQDCQLWRGQDHRKVFARRVPVTDIENVSRAVGSILILITSGHRIEEDSIRIYVDS
jgi:hypothetical protein